MADILIVEDNNEIAEMLKDFLIVEKYSVLIAKSGEQALELYERYGAGIVILDIMLPGIDGFAVCKRIREHNNTPILIVSAKCEKEDKLNGLQLGADDYIEKPYDIDIMLAKIRVIFNRTYNTKKIKFDNIIIDKTAHEVYRDDKKIQMTAKEFDLLIYLTENKGRVLSKELLFNKIWGFESESEAQTLTVHIKWLREKIEDNPKSPKHIITVWGVGYRFEE